MTRTFPSTEIIMSERRHAAQEAMSRALDFRPEEIRTPEPQIRPLSRKDVVQVCTGVLWADAGREALWWRHGPPW